MALPLYKIRGYGGPADGKVRGCNATALEEQFTQDMHQGAKDADDRVGRFQEQVYQHRSAIHEGK